LHGTWAMKFKKDILLPRIPEDEDVEMWRKNLLELFKDMRRELWEDLNDHETRIETLEP